MFIRVTAKRGDSVLINTDHICCISQSNDTDAIVVYTDDTELTIKESVDEVEQMLKGSRR